MSDPITCELTPDAIRAARERLLPGLADRAVHREVTETGYRLTFQASAEILMAITRVIDAERQCCRWLRFDVSVAENGGPIILSVSGPDGARDFLAALLAT